MRPSSKWQPHTTSAGGSASAAFARSKLATCASAKLLCRASANASNDSGSSATTMRLGLDMGSAV